MMNKFEAEKIINKYGEAVAQGGIARNASLLPCNKSIIKYAYFIYIEAGIKEGIFTEEFLSSLWGSYCCLDHFIDEEQAEVINKTFELVKNKQIDLNLEMNQNAKAIYEDFVYNNLTSNKNLEEICEFIDVMKNKYKYTMA